MITQTSLIAYLDVKTKLGPRHVSVVQALQELGNANNRMLAAQLGWEINRVTPRVLELRQKGKVVQAYIDQDITGRSTIFWKLKQRDADAETNDAY